MYIIGDHCTAHDTLCLSALLVLLAADLCPLLLPKNKIERDNWTLM